MKVKSRWRRTSELEQVTRNGGNGGPGSDQGSSCNNSPSQSQSVSSSPKQTAFSCSVPLEELTSATDNYTNKKDREKETAALLAERFKEFDILEENLYLTDRKTSKEVKRMQCDCSLTKEEIARGELGCGEDCINRLLMIEW